MNRITVFALCIGVLICTSPVATGKQNDKKMSATSASDKRFLAAVSQGNLAEIQSGELALTKSSNTSLQRVAQMIINDHTRAQEETKILATSINAPLPMEPSSVQKSAYSALKKRSGITFDNAYIQRQIKDHSATIALFQKQEKMTSNPQIRAFATKTLPALRHHAESLRKLLRNGQQ